MDTFAGTTFVDYRLSIADQGKQTSVFSVPVCRKQTEVWCFRLQQTTEVAVFR
jgi:hypothetical protein